MHEGKQAWAVMAAAAVMTVVFVLGLLPTQGKAAEPEPTRPREQVMRPALLKPAVAADAVAETEPTNWEAAKGMDGSHIFVYDCEEETMLYSSTDVRDTLYPASITKLFSVWVAMQYLAPEQEIQAGRELGLLQPGSSTAYIPYGSVLTAGMLAEGMLLPSGNDAAYILAAAAGRAIGGEELSAVQAVAAFVEELNRQAEELGMKGTHFENPDGYHDEGHYSCPEDLAKMGALALGDLLISRLVRLQSDSVRFASGEVCTWRNNNRLVRSDSEYYCPAAVGLKTGYTKEAGQCLLAAFEAEGRTILVGIFGSESKVSRYENAVKLMEMAMGI